MRSQISDQVAPHEPDLDRLVEAFPAKSYLRPGKYIGILDHDHLRDRQAGLDAFLTGVVGHAAMAADAVLADFLSPYDGFDVEAAGAEASVEYFNY